MAFADFAPVARPSIVATLAGAAASWLAALRAERARRAVLNDLLFMPEHRLRDLGIDRHTLHQQIDVAFWPTRK